MSACGFVHTAADLLRLDSHRFQCKSCGKSFPSSQQMSINSLGESQSHSGDGRFWRVFRFSVLFGLVMFFSKNTVFSNRRMSLKEA